MLTPAPITLENTSVIEPKKPISAITSGASIEIDVSNIIKLSQKDDINEFRSKVKKLFPPHSIEARLVQKDGKESTLSYGGNFLINKENTRLSLYSEKGVPTNKEFSKVIITSKIRIKDVKVYWKNYKH